MKKIIKLLSVTLLTGLVMFSASCKKTDSEIVKKDTIGTTKSVVTNQAVIKLDGVQQTLDSLVVKPRTINSKLVSIDIFYYLKGTGGAGVISLYFAPSNPAYATGTKLNLLNNDAELLYINNAGNTFDDSSGVFPAQNPNPVGIITITKNDVAASRIEGTLSGCILPLVEGSGSGPVTIDGSFGITY